MNGKIEQFKVDKTYPSVYYIPNFITEEEEKFLLEKIYKAPKPKWTQLSGRRLQNWGGLPHPKGMVPEALPQWLLTYINRVNALNIFDGRTPNHVLVNEYEAGQGIMPHLDGPLFYPTITTVTLGSHTVLDFYKPFDQTVDEEKSASPCASDMVTSSYESRYIFSILLRPRSLVAFKEDMYNTYLHGIQERTTDTITEQVINPDKELKIDVGDQLERKTRVSLTIRNVPKVLKMKLRLGKS